MKRYIKTGAAVLLAVVLLWICPAASAAENVGAVTQVRSYGEGVPAEGDAEIDFFDDLKAERRIRDTLFVCGAALVLLGACGFLCMGIWRMANKRRDRSQETREGILHEIERAEQRHHKMKRRGRHAHAENAPSDAPHVTQESDPVQAAPVQPAEEAPIVPSTPVSMQPNGKARVQNAVRPQAVQPEAEAKDKYDVDEILREVREGKL